MRTMMALGLCVLLTAGPRAGGEELTNSIGMKLIGIAPGSLEMGQEGPAADYQVTKHPAKFDDADPDERPVHRVKISSPFHLGATEVTLGQYRRYKPEHLAGKGNEDDAVTFVSWEDANAFCRWLGEKEGRAYRLPTEAEWEYACRAGTKTLFHTGDALPDGFHKWFGDIGFRERFFKDGRLPAEFAPDTTKVDLRVGRTAANAWGLYDMHGNVAEWCHDWYGRYEAGEQTDPVGRAGGDLRVMRGGNHSTFTRMLRSANRSAWIPEARNAKTGFRVVLGELPRTAPLAVAPAPLNQRDVKQGTVAVEEAGDAPFFAGPIPFVKVPANSKGPAFSSHNHSPGIAECPNGDLLAVWYSCVDEAGTELSNLASRLRRGASAWEEASVFWDGADINDHGPKLWSDGKGTLFHFARGYFENIVRTSSDSGATWSKAQMIQPVCEVGNAALRTKEGTIVMTLDSRQASMAFSKDGGKTWGYHDATGKVSDYRPGGKGFRHPGIHAGIVQLEDGRLMAMGRYDRVEDQERFGMKTPIGYSSDLGETWTYQASEFSAISSVQRAVLMRLREGPLLFCSFTDQWRDRATRKGLAFKSAAGGELTGFGLFAALSMDEGKTWPVRRLITPGGEDRRVNAIDRVEFTMERNSAEPCGYLAACQTRDGRVQLITSRNHYVFNLAWLKALPE